LIISSAGLVGINETLNADMTIGLTINQAANDNEILAFKSSDVDQGCTGVAEAYTYGYMQKFYGDYGGLQITGIVSGDAQGNALRLEGITADATPQSGKTASYNGVVNIVAFKGPGAAKSELASNENILAIYGGGGTRFIFDADGDAYADVQWTTFDDHDDVAMLHDIEATMVPDTFGKAMKYDAPYLQKLGIIGEASLHEENGKTRGMICTTKLQMLHHGSIRQVHQQLQDVKVFTKTRSPH